jgi:hypothetical protein
MYDEEETEENTTTEDKSCPTCGLRQYGETCANCNTAIAEDPDLDKRKEDEADEYDWRERR